MYWPSAEDPRFFPRQRGSFFPPHGTYLVAGNPAQRLPEPSKRNNAMSNDTDLEPGDFHVAVKRREHSEAPWRWEIWAAGRTKATEQSEGHFATMSEAMKA